MYLIIYFVFAFCGGRYQLPVSALALSMAMGSAGPTIHRIQHDTSYTPPRVVEMHFNTREYMSTAGLLQRLVGERK
jgi:hypothetical protein